MFEKNLPAMADENNIPPNILFVKVFSNLDNKKIKQITFIIICKRFICKRLAVISLHTCPFLTKIS
jgi:hypothetical protein